MLLENWQMVFQKNLCEAAQSLIVDAENRLDVGKKYIELEIPTFGCSSTKISDTCEVYAVMYRKFFAYPKMPSNLNKHPPSTVRVPQRR